MKEIIENDVAKLKELSLKVLKEDHFQSIERLGGMTNHSYRVQTPKHDVVFRIPGEGTEAMINRENEISRNFFKPQMLKKCLLRKKERKERLRMEMV